MYSGSTRLSSYRVVMSFSSGSCAAPHNLHPHSLVGHYKVLHVRRGRSTLPFHEARLHQQLGQVLADGAGRTHHELKDDLPALHGIAVEALNVPGVAVRPQSDALICPNFTPVEVVAQQKGCHVCICHRFLVRGRGNVPAQHRYSQVVFEDWIQDVPLQTPLQLLTVPQTEARQNGDAFVVIPAGHKHFCN